MTTRIWNRFQESIPEIDCRNAISEIALLSTVNMPSSDLHFGQSETSRPVGANGPAAAVVGAPDVPQVS